MTQKLSPLAQVIRHGSEAEQNAAWIALAAANGTGMAHDIWTMATRDAENPDIPTEPVQEQLW